MTASNEEWNEYNENFMQSVANGGDISEDENTDEPDQEEAILLPTITMREGLKAMNGLKAMSVEKGYTNLLRVLTSTISEAERILSSDSNKKQKEITDYFAKQ